ncbi:Protein OS-9 [Dimargaris cristalligena]|nr:Protein OS-9 [Dimargaris cristalligena]
MSRVNSAYFVFYGLTALSLCLVWAPAAKAWTPAVRQAVYDDILAKPPFEVVDDHQLLSSSRAQVVLQQPIVHYSHLQRMRDWSEDLEQLFSLPVDPFETKHTSSDISPWYEPVAMQLTSDTTYICFAPQATFPEPPEPVAADGTPLFLTSFHPSGSSTSSPPSDGQSTWDTYMPMDERSQVERGLRLISETQSPSECLSYFQGWWTYEYCPQGHVRQFRYSNAEASPNMPNMNFDYVLGQYNHRVRSLTTPPDHGSLAQKRDRGWGSQRAQAGTTDVSFTSLHSTDNSQFLTQEWSGGTICDVTGKPRTVQIQFHCTPEDAPHIASVHEIAVCMYVMVIHAPNLCKDPAFVTQPTKPFGEITCHRVVSDAQFDEHIQSLHRPKIDSQQQHTSIPLQNPQAAQDPKGNVPDQDSPANLHTQGDTDTPLQRTGTPPESQTLFLKWIEEQLGLAGSATGEAGTRRHAWTTEEIEAIQTVWQRLVEQGFSYELEMLKTATERLQPGQSTKHLASILNDLHHKVLRPGPAPERHPAGHAPGPDQQQVEGLANGADAAAPLDLSQLMQEFKVYVQDENGNFQPVADGDHGSPHAQGGAVGDEAKGPGWSNDQITAIRDALHHQVKNVWAQAGFPGQADPHTDDEEDEEHQMDNAVGAAFGHEHIQTLAQLLGLNPNQIRDGSLRNNLKQGNEDLAEKTDKSNNRGKGKNKAAVDGQKPTKKSAPKPNQNGVYF